MTPKQHRTQPGDRGAARSRRQIAEKYLEVAALLASEDDGASINTCIGNAVLAGIAAGDAICLTAMGERYTGQDHAAAADLLGRVDRDLGKQLRDLIDLKTASHYGDRLLRQSERDLALRRATSLVETARSPRRSLRRGSRRHSRRGPAGRPYPPHAEGAGGQGRWIRSTRRPGRVRHSTRSPPSTARPPHADERAPVGAKVDSPASALERSCGSPQTARNSVHHAPPCRPQQRH